MPLYDPSVKAISASNSTFKNTVRVTGGPNITAGTDASGVSLSAAAQSVQTQGVVRAISASNSTFDQTVRVTGGPNITVGTDANGVSISGLSGVSGIVPITLSGNTTGTMAEINSGTLSLAGGNNITLSQSGTNKVTISAGGGAPTIEYFDNAGAQSGVIGLASTSMTFNTLMLQPLTPNNENFPGNMTASTAMLQFSYNHSSTASSSAHSSTVGLGVYTRANSTQLSLLNSVQTTWAQAAATNQTASYHGQRWITINSSLWSAQPTFSQGLYWFGMFVRSSNMNRSASFVGQFLQAQAQRSGTIGSSVGTATSMGHYPFMGIHSVSQTAFPASIAASEVNKAHALANFVPNVVFNNVASSF
jgi:hypothetical protein